MEFDTESIAHMSVTGKVLYFSKKRVNFQSSPVRTYAAPLSMFDIRLCYILYNWYIIVFSSAGFSCVIAPAVSTPAFLLPHSQRPSRYQLF